DRDRGEPAGRPRPRAARRGGREGGRRGAPPGHARGRGLRDADRDRRDEGARRGALRHGPLMPHLPTFFLQIIVVLSAARLVGRVFRKMGQPQVVGEMFAGILLGPSLLGWLAPGAYAALFPPASLGFLNALSQFGLLLFMFLVGLDLDA